MVRSMKRIGKTFSRLMQALREVKAYREGRLDLPATRVTAHVPNAETLAALKEGKNPDQLTSYTIEEWESSLDVKD